MNDKASPAGRPHGEIDLDTPVQFVRGVGPARAEHFATLGVNTLGDLLEYFPRDYRWMPPPEKISRLQPDRETTIIALVEAVDYHARRRPPALEAQVADDTGWFRIVWFHGGYLRNHVTAGAKILAWGKVIKYKHQLQMVNPRFALLPDGVTPDTEALGGAIYPASADLSTGQIKHAVKNALPHVPRLVEETYDQPFLAENNLIPRPRAFQWIHQPDDDEQAAAAIRRLKFDELFLMQLGLAIRRHRLRTVAAATPMKHSPQIDSRIRRRFPFILTADQDQAIEEIVADMARSHPMNRLLQGDVGSGKTVVALYAALLAVANKTQVAILAPTEILARQHYQNIEKYLDQSKVRVAMLGGGLNAKKRSAILDRAAAGNIDIIVGTHAILQEDVKFKSLGLIVIDEQHKFGVHQRATLRKRACPHCLVMTATPIPRTLAMTAFGDLDCSVIKNSPPGRGKVVTRLVAPPDRPKAYKFIRERLAAGRQAFFVYPRLVGSDEAGDVKAAINEHRILSTKIFPEFEVGLVHGQMPSAEKQSAMENFRTGKTRILVATVVVEVGVDVPNATIMVIEDADRFGLAQLHQLRGRIGRGQSNSYCLLFAENESDIARDRLEIMTRSNDGFAIAEHDLRLRGPGDLFSPRQHGLPDLKLANIVEDSQLLLMARRLAAELVQRDPYLKDGNHHALRSLLLQEFGDALNLVDIG